jgi:hypothetical protein
MDAPAELQVTRQELAQLAAVSSRASLVVLPSGQGKKSRVAVVDDSGVLQCIEVKKGVATSILKTVMPEGKVECITTNAAASADRAGEIESNVSSSSAGTSASPTDPRWSQAKIVVRFCRYTLQRAPSFVASTARARKCSSLRRT